MTRPTDPAVPEHRLLAQHTVWQTLTAADWLYAALMFASAASAH